MQDEMTRLLKILPLVPLLWFSVAAQADEGDWYVSPSIVYTDDDGERLIDDGVSGGQIQVGREMSEHFWLEGLLGYHDIDGFPGQEHLELGFNAIRSFRPDSLFSPYVIGGLGILSADVGVPSFGGSPPAGETSTSATATAGLGMKLRFGDSPWALRAEYRLRHAFDDGGLTDHVGSFGIQYSFGGSSKQPLVVAAGEPEPAGYSDSDQDGVTDDRDRCPGTIAGAKVDVHGCEVQETIEFRNIYFGFDSDVVLPTSRRLLDHVASVLERHPDLKVEIAGFADSRGSERYNMALSLRRAEAVHRYLEQAGVNTANLAIKGYGMIRLDPSDVTAGNLAENRRVEMRITNR